MGLTTREKSQGWNSIFKVVVGGGGWVAKRPRQIGDLFRYCNQTVYNVHIIFVIPFKMNSNTYCMFIYNYDIYLSLNSINSDTICC